MSDKFDFSTANQLIQAVEGAASALDVKNGQMEKRFGNLREYFKDAGYDVFAADMSAADTAIKEVITQLHEVSRNIGEYAIRLRDEV